MKLKGITPLERHAEKIVLGLVGLVFLGVLAMQFLTSPNAVKAGSRTVAPSQIYADLESQAQSLLDRVRDADPRLPDVATPTLMARDFGVVEPLPGGDGPDVAFGEAARIGAEAGDLASGPVMTLRVPAPSAPLAVARWNTLDPYFVEEFPQAAGLAIRQSQPYDLATVSVESTVDGTALLAALRATEDGRRPIPSGWWSRGMAILRVEVEREARLPGEDAWGQAEVVPAAFWTPGLFERARVADETLTPATLAQLVDSARADRSLVEQPPFVRTIAGPAWGPPSDPGLVRLDLAEMEEADRLRRQIEGAQVRFDRLQERIASRDPARASADDSARDTEQREALVTEMMELRSRLDELLGRGPVDPAAGNPATTGFQGVGGQGAGYQPSAAGSIGSAASADLTRDAERKVWVHDLAVKPGETYRYRTRVVVNNPLFGRERSIGADAPAELLEAAARPFVESAWSDWSEPVEVDRADYFFIASASDGGGEVGGGTRARAEVFQMFYGFYRRAEVNLEPGAPVAGKFEIEEGLDLFTFDPAAVDPQALQQFVLAQQQKRQQQRQVAQPLPTPGGVRPVPGGPAAGPGGVGPGPARGPGSAAPPDPSSGRRTPPRPRPTTAPAPSDEPETLPAGIARIEGDLPVTIDAVLLDVALEPDLVGGREVVVATLYDPFLGVIRRLASEQREDPSYARMRLSAMFADEADVAAPAPSRRP